MECPKEYECFGCPDRNTSFCPFESQPELDGYIIGIDLGQGDDRTAYAPRIKSEEK